MSLVINPESELGKEMAKWDARHPLTEYPKMLYRAGDLNGKKLCMAPPPSPFGWRDQAEYQAAINQAESFTSSCQRIVMDESQERLAKGQGWSDGPAEALALAEKEARALGDAAAEANFAARRMSDMAQRELDEVNGLTHEHVADVGRRTKKTLREQAEA